MALNPCVKSIVCGLSTPVIAALDAIVQTYITAINAQLAVISAEIVKLDIALVPVNLSLSVAQSLLDQFDSITNLLPRASVEGCGDLGDIMVSIRGVSDGATAELEDFRQDAIRKLSLKSELTALQTTLNANKLQFEELQSVLRSCDA